MPPIAPLLLLLAAVPAVLGAPDAKQVAFVQSSESEAGSESWPHTPSPDPYDYAQYAHTPFQEPRARFDGHEVWRVDLRQLDEAARAQVVDAVESDVSGVGLVWRSFTDNSPPRISGAYHQSIWTCGCLSATQGPGGTAQPWSSSPARNSATPA